MSHSMKGAVDLGAATGITTTRKTLGTNPATSAHDVVILGNQTIPVEMAVKMGLMDKSAAGVFTTLQGAQAFTKVTA